MQNKNGPCPLLAIANVLSLRNELKLPAGIRDITQARRELRQQQLQQMQHMLLCSAQATELLKDCARCYCSRVHGL
jgi:hypothetical protein